MDFGETVIVDDAGARRRLMLSLSYRPETFATAEAFLEGLRARRLTAGAAACLARPLDRSAIRQPMERATAAQPPLSTGRRQPGLPADVRPVRPER